MSSFINKSKKTFKPKAPQARRHEASASAASSIRGSQEPRPTPQPSARSTISPTLTASRPRVRSPELQRLPTILSTPDQTQQPTVQHASDWEGNRQQDNSDQDATDGGPPRKRARILGTPPSSALMQIAQRTPPPTQENETVAQPPGNNTLTDDTPEQGANALLQLSQDLRRPEAEQEPSRRASLSTEARAHAYETSPNHQDVVKQPRRSTRSRTAVKQKATPVSQDKEQDAPTKRGGKRPRKSKDAPQTSDATNATEAGTNAEVVVVVDDDEQVESLPQTMLPVPSKEKTLSGKTAAKTSESRKKVTKKTDATKSRRKATAEEQADAIVAAATKSRPKPRVKGRNRKNAAMDPATGLEDEDEGERGPDADTSEIDAARSRKRARSPTPADGETREVDPGLQKLGDLPRLKIGRLGPREQKLRERDEQQAKERKEKRQAAARAEMEEFMGLEGDELVKAKDEKIEREMREKTEAAEREDRERVWRMEDEGQWSDKPWGRWGKSKANDDESNKKQSEADTNGDENDGNEDEDNEPDDSQFEVFPNSVPAFRIVDGRIVADPNARALDLPAVSAPVEQQEQTDIDRRVTEASFRHRESRARWDEAKLALFYEGLRRWGTDFGMVSTWVPGMSRNQVKRKFTQEEKAHPDRISNALKKENRIPTTVEEIVEKRGRPLSDPKAWQEDIDKRVAEMREKARLEREAAEERLRNRGVSKEKQTAATSSKAKGNGKNNAEDAVVVEDEDGEDVSLRPVAPPSKQGRGKAKGRYQAVPEVVNYTF